MRRSRAGRTCSTLASARSDVSSIPVDRAAGRRPQADRDRDGLVVLEQQRRQVRPGLEPVAADRAASGVHRIAEAAQAFDVVADRPRAHLEPLGELGAGPVARRLEQREQAEESRRGSHDRVDLTRLLGTKPA